MSAQIPAIVYARTLTVTVMKYLVLFLTLFTLLLSRETIGQSIRLSKKDIQGKWIYIDKTSEGFKFIDECDKSFIKISKKYIVFAYESDPHDTIQIDKIQNVGDSLFIELLPNKFEFTFIDASFIDIPGIVKVAISTGESQRTFSFNLFMTKFGNREKYIKNMNPCPDLKNTTPSFKIIKAD